MEEYDLDTDFLKSPYEILKNHKIYALSDIGFNKFLLSKKNILNLKQRFTLKDIDSNNNNKNSNNTIRLPLNKMMSHKSQPDIKTMRNTNLLKVNTELKLKTDNKNTALQSNPQKSFESFFQTNQKKKLQREKSIKTNLLCYPNLNSPNKTYSSCLFQRLNNTLLNSLCLSNKDNTQNMSNDLNEIKSNDKLYYGLLSIENDKLMQTFTKATNKQYLLEKHLPRINLGKRGIICNKPIHHCILP